MKIIIMNKISKINNKYFQSLMVLVGGSFTAQVVLAIQQPLLTRIFSAESLGIYTYLMAIPQTFISILCARYDAAIVYEKNEKKAFCLIKLCLIITVMLGIVITVIYAVYLILFSQDYKSYLYLMPAICLYLISYGITNVLNAYNNRNAEYKLISSMYVMRTMCQCLGVLIPGFIFISIFHFDWMSVSILVVPYCLGMFFGLMTQSKALREHRQDIVSCSRKEMKQIAEIHKKQPLFSMPALFANSLSYSVITIAIESLFGAKTLGYYSISTRLLGMPLSLISGNVSRIYMEEASNEYARTGGYKNAFRRSFFFLLMLAILMILTMYFFAPLVCEWLFGSGWYVAGVYIKILAVMFGIRFIATAVSQSLSICQKQQYELFIQIFLVLAALLSSLLAAVFDFTVEQFLLCVCILKSIGFALDIVVVYYFSKPKKNSLIVQ